MVALGDTARITQRGGKADGVGVDSPIENLGWAVWSAAHTRAKLRGTPKLGPEKFGMQEVAGRELDVNMKKIVTDLWPQIKQGGPQNVETFVSEIYRFLRASQNAACVRVPGLNSAAVTGGASAGPRWWIADVWKDTKAVRSTRFVETPRERKLSKAEAGEDRKPAPVTVTRRIEEDTTTFAGKVRAGILAAVVDSALPVTAAEITTSVGVAEISTIRVYAGELVKEGRLWRRMQTSTERKFSGGRKAYLYWNAEPVPLRDPDTFSPVSAGPQTRATGQRRPLMERINQLKAGEMVAVGGATAAERKEIQELIDAGLIVYVGGMDRDVTLAPTVSETTDEPPAAEPAPEVQPEPEPEPEPDPQQPVPAPAVDGGALVQAFLEQALAAERAAWQAERDELIEQRASAQDQLNAVRAELESSRTAADLARQQVKDLQDGIRKLLG